MYIELYYNNELCAYLPEGADAHAIRSPELEGAVTAGGHDYHVLTTHTHLHLRDALAVPRPRPVQHCGTGPLVRDKSCTKYFKNKRYLRNRGS